MIEIFIAGFLGGLIRGLVGISKVIRASPSRKKKIRKDYIAVTLLTAGGLGLMVGVFIANDIRFALLAGYAGADFIENLLHFFLFPFLSLPHISHSGLSVRIHVSNMQRWFHSPIALRLDSFFATRHCLLACVCILV